MPHPPTTSTVHILGLPFSTLSAEALIKELESGGLLVAPSGPGLATLNDDAEYAASLKSAKWIIPDSGFMVLIWNLFNADKIHRCSGLKLFRAFIDHIPKTSEAQLFLVNPNEKHSQANQQWLQRKGFSIQEQQHYVAPHYTHRPITDPVLLKLIEAQKPDYILINIGGGTQEILGQYLSENLSYRPAILCTGAAIAFLTGHQANIPVWADTLYLGWLCRILSSPGSFIYRYVKALKLLPLMLKTSK